MDAVNPLLEAWNALGKEHSFGMWHFIRATTWEQVDRAIAILGIDDDEDLNGFVDRYRNTADAYGAVDAAISVHAMRRAACSKFAWAIPSDDALDALVKLSPLVEIGAGNGYWAALLAGRGADVVAYDITRPGPKNHWHPRPGLWFPVRRGGPQAAGRHPDRTLFLCWPPMSDMAERTLVAYEAAGGQRLAYIGEGNGGCTADEGFHARIGKDCWHDEGERCAHPDPTWEQEDFVALPQWEGIHDNLTIYRRQS